MAKPVTRVDIFIASPEVVSTEKDIASAIVANLQYDPSLRDTAYFEWNELELR